MGKTFNKAALQKYNGEKALVVVDSFSDDPDRGDTHGHAGIARRIAEKTGGEFVHLDFHSLEALYPHVGGKKDPRQDHNERLLKFFDDKGYPDFYITCHLAPEIKKRLNKNAAGVIVHNFNENILDELGVHALPEVVPHHLTPALLQHEGQKFATEYEELPRPFIVVNTATLYNGNTPFAGKLASLKDVYPQATFFVLSCHRVHPAYLEQFVGTLEKGLDDKKNFPVVPFDFVLQTCAYGKEGVWNPYVGALDQADHIIIEGESCSMVSEALMKGKAIYVERRDLYEELAARHIVRDIYAHKPGAPLSSPAIAPVDATGMAARGLMRLQSEAAFNKASARARRETAKGPLKTLRTAAHKLGTLFGKNYKIV